MLTVLVSAPLLAMAGMGALRAAQTPIPGEVDRRIRTADYNPNQVYRLHGYAGYEIDLQFAADEQVTGVSGGDLEGLVVGTHANHLSLKPKAVPLSSNFSIYTNRRVYHIDYHATDDTPTAAGLEVTYAVRFTYPDRDDKAAQAKAAVDAALTRPAQILNRDYWFCGDVSLQPSVAYDDGLQTHLRWTANVDWPAIYLQERDGSESLLNFSVNGSEMVLHLTAREFVVRRGSFSGCIQNRSYGRAMRAAEYGTVSPDVRRVLKDSQ